MNSLKIKYFYKFLFLFILFSSSVVSFATQYSFDSNLPKSCPTNNEGTATVNPGDSIKLNAGNCWAVDTQLNCQNGKTGTVCVFNCNQSFDQQGQTYTCPSSR